MQVKHIWSTYMEIFISLFLARLVSCYLMDCLGVLKFLMAWRWDYNVYFEFGGTTIIEFSENFIGMIGY